MNYIEDVTKELTNELPGCPPELINYYALLVFVKGTMTTKQDIHDAWSIWQNEYYDSDHPSLVPFSILSVEKQNLDEPYMEAVKKVAERGPACPECGDYHGWS